MSKKNSIAKQASVVRRNLLDALDEWYDNLPPAVALESGTLLIAYNKAVKAIQKLEKKQHKQDAKENAKKDKEVAQKAAKSLSFTYPDLFVDTEEEGNSFFSEFEQVIGDFLLACREAGVDSDSRLQ